MKRSSIFEPLGMTDTGFIVPRAQHRRRAQLYGFDDGFGLGVAVVVDPARALPTICGGHAGTVGWPGGFGGWWQADPVDRSVKVFLSHNVVERDQFAKGIGFDVYEAIVRFEELSR